MRAGRKNSARGGRSRRVPARRGSIIVISAPSGAGKSTLVKRLLACCPGLMFSVSHTTRRSRAGERNGREYFFVSPARFGQMIARNEFAEWAEVHGHLYGTARAELGAAEATGRDILLDLDVQGHRQIKQRLPEAVSVFILPPSFEELDRRLRRRHLDAPEVIAQRLADARQEITHWPEYDYLVVNDRLPVATEALKSVVHAARHRRLCQQDRARKISETFGG
ncbi:MAG TPA: guanylate kinase [Terriglobia bacterium]|nr:guanylate kinase [Terriglobia bacterium]